MMIRDLCFERAIWAFGTESSRLVLSSKIPRYLAYGRAALD